VPDRFVHLKSTALAPEARDTPILVRDWGTAQGKPLVVLHGGWGYGIYPFDSQVAALKSHYRILIPDRTGYGRSGALDLQRSDFHQRAADETFAVLDALGIGCAALWGHSDGAVIALRMALMSPSRVAAVIAEATHFFRSKPHSRGFFETMQNRPEDLGARVTASLAAEHGSRWRHLIHINGMAWLQIAEAAPTGEADLYDGKLGQLTVPTLLVHGGLDPRAEPGEFDQIVATLRRSLQQDLQVLMLDAGGHSPHSERANADAVTAAAAAFLSTARKSP
jgi:pimeloyl-ACP methyl ester carboxylesterase